MARPIKSTVDYFPHYISEGKSMFILDQKFKNDGFATWFKLLEQLARTDDHWIDGDDSSTMMFMAAKCHINESTLIEILDILSGLNEIDSELWEQCRVIYSQKFVDSVSDAYRKRTNDIITRERLIQHLSGLGRNIEGLSRNVPPETEFPQGKGDRNPQRKVKESKQKESKGKKEAAAKPPTLNEVHQFCIEKGFPKELGTRAFDYYEAGRKQRNGRVWKDSSGNTVKSWKQKLIGVWFKPDRKLSVSPAPTTGNAKAAVIAGRDYSEFNDQ